MPESAEFPQELLTAAGLAIGKSIWPEYSPETDPDPAEFEQGALVAYGVYAHRQIEAADEHRAAMVALMDKHFPRREPSVQRAPNRRGDDAWVDARDDERSAIDDFIDRLIDAGVRFIGSPPAPTS